MSENSFLGFMLVPCVILLLLCFVGMGASCSSFIKMEEEKKADNCKLISKVETGKRVYCGKACWRQEYREEYSCNSGTKVYIN